MEKFIWFSVLFIIIISSIFFACTQPTEPQPDFVGTWVGSDNTLSTYLEMKFNPDKSFQISAYNSSGILYHLEYGIYIFASGKLLLQTNLYEDGIPLKIISPPPKIYDSLSVNISNGIWPISQINEQTGIVLHIDFVRGN